MSFCSWHHLLVDSNSTDCVAPENSWPENIGGPLEGFVGCFVDADTRALPYNVGSGMD